MKSLGLRDGDLFLTDTGDIATVSGLDAVIQGCETVMKAVQGEMIYNMIGGIPYKAAVWDNYRPELFEAAARAVMLGVDGVEQVVSFSQSFENNRLQYTAVIRTIYGVGEVGS